ncbi:MAG TPA: hypothetical protein VEC99_16115, partial [Clostridia bacterium]|nr:hypothetical protein [Clostridia bacterium]
RFENLYLRDLAKGTTYAVSRNGVANSNDSQATMSSDGHIVIYVGFIYGPGSYANIYVWDAGTLTNLFQKSLGSIPVSQVEVAISAIGRQMAFSIPNALLAVNLESKKSLTVETNVYLSYAHLRLDAEGHWLSCSRVKNATPRTSQVALYDWGDFSQKIVSHLPDSDNGGNGDSGYAVISEDGRFVAYESEASDLVANDTNSLPDIFLYDQHTGVNTLITAEQSGEFSSNNRSQNLVFSRNSRVLFFAGLSAGMALGDYNQKQNLYAYKLLYGKIVTFGVPDRGVRLSWPSTIRRNYRVQYKDHVEEPDWHDLGGVITNSGNEAWIQDNAPSPNGRLYRIGTF